MGTCETHPNHMNGKNTHNSHRRSKTGADVNKNRSENNLMYCHNYHPLTLICNQPNCQASALLCQDEQCSQGIRRHRNCKTKTLFEVTSMIKERTKLHDKMMKKMHDIQTYLIKELIAKRKKHFDDVLVKLRDKRFTSIVGHIYHQRSDQIDFKGNDSHQFIEKIRNSNEMVEQIQNQCLDAYSKEIKEAAKDLVEVQKIVMIDYAQKCKIPLDKRNQSDMSSRPSAQCISDNFQLESKIVSDKGQISFIEDALGDPKSLRLLFRASEHGFKANTFHEKCDNIPHTFTLIKTQFDRRVGGYTPLTWNIAPGFAKDPSGTSFLLSLDSREIMDLIKPEKAIQCIPNYGPVFGGGCDIAVCDKCNISQDSCTNFAYSYNCEQNKYQYGQEAWNALCGVKQGKNFRVLQYEVFEVLW